MGGEYQGTSWGEKKASNANGGPRLAEATIEGSSVFFPRQGSCTSHQNVNLGAASPIPAHFWLLSPGGRYYLGPMFAPRAHKTLSTSLPHPAPQIPMGGRAPTLPSPKRKCLHFSPMKVAGETITFKFPHPPKTQPSGPLTSIPVPKPTDTRLLTMHDH